MHGAVRTRIQRGISAAVKPIWNGCLQPNHAIELLFSNLFDNRILHAHSIERRDGPVQAQ